MDFREQPPEVCSGDREAEELREAASRSRLKWSINILQKNSHPAERVGLDRGNGPRELEYIEYFVLYTTLPPPHPNGGAGSVLRFSTLAAIIAFPILLWAHEMGGRVRGGDLTSGWAEGLRFASSRGGCDASTPFSALGIADWQNFQFYAASLCSCS